MQSHYFDLTVRSMKKKIYQIDSIKTLAGIFLKLDLA